MIMERGTKAIDDAALAKRPVPNNERSMYKAEGALAVELLTQAVDRLMFLAGSSAFSKEQPLQRYWRDLNMGARHIAHHPLMNYELHGAHLLDVEQDIILGSAYYIE
jgi:alkylation response protein AidB-like acyl-CoA dehydrogenase